MSIASDTDGSLTSLFCFFQAEDGIRYWSVTGVQTCALPIYVRVGKASRGFWLLRQWASIKTIFEDRFEAFIRTGPQREGTLAGRFQSLVTIAFPEPRSEERRVGKECRARRWAYHEKTRMRRR